MRGNTLILKSCSSKNVIFSKINTNKKLYQPLLFRIIINWKKMIKYIKTSLKFVLKSYFGGIECKLNSINPRLFKWLVGESITRKCCWQLAFINNQCFYLRPRSKRWRFVQGETLLKPIVMRHALDKQIGRHLAALGGVVDRLKTEQNLG